MIKINKMADCLHRFALYPTLTFTLLKETDAILFFRGFKVENTACYNDSKATGIRELVHTGSLIFLCTYQKLHRII